MKKIVILDAGHGEDTCGKASPDGKLKEYAYARNVKNVLKTWLIGLGYEVYDVCPEMSDISINTRVKRANEMAKKNPGAKCILISIHSNASAMTGWHDGNGWEVFTALQCSLNAKVLATKLAESAMKHGLKVRKGPQGQLYKQKNLGICRDTSMPAVLVENFFHDNKREVEMAMTQEGFNRFVETLAQGVVGYFAN